MRRLEAILLKLLEGQERLEKKFDGVENDIKCINNELNGINNRLENVGNEINGVNNRLENVENDVNSIKFTVARIEMQQEETILSLLKHIKKQVDDKDTNTRKNLH
ncbi:hypothetical protein [Peribacillus alkalitolerans]|uniref:hypothetical protein n=1 Tax=Peribacillus alkalitolerans TaxID=1550385 RepID=UPI0013D0C03E|nr:hypothetical protein [Peribacillus alkalitolerans]